MECMAENLVELGKIKEGEMTEEKKTAREKIEKRIRDQFDYQKRNINDRFTNLGSIISLSDWPTYLNQSNLLAYFSADLEGFKNKIAQEYGIVFDDDSTQN